LVLNGEQYTVSIFAIAAAVVVLTLPETKGKALKAD
jgi:hypothetical protein